MGFLSEFKEFVSKGNVLDLAVGVIIGAAFGKIVSSLTDDIIMPIIGLVTGGIDFKNWFFALDGNSYPTLEKAQAAGGRHRQLRAVHKCRYLLLHHCLLRVPDCALRQPLQEAHRGKREIRPGADPRGAATHRNSRLAGAPPAVRRILVPRLAVATQPACLLLGRQAGFSSIICCTDVNELLLGIEYALAVSLVWLLLLPGCRKQ